MVSRRRVQKVRMVCRSRRRWVGVSLVYRPYLVRSSAVAAHQLSCPGHDSAHVARYASTAPPRPENSVR